MAALRKNHPRQVAAGVLGLLGCVALLAIAAGPALRRTELEFANTNDYGVGYVWEAPYPGAGPETPEWDKTPSSVGQGATNVMDEAHREHNVLGNDYMYPDYARAPRKMQLWQQQQQVPRQREARTGLWIGAPQSFLPPDGDYPGGSTGIPEDGYVAFETGYGQQPYHGLIAPMQEAGMMEARRRALINRRRRAQLSIIDPGAPHSEDAFHGSFNDWELGNSRADLSPPYDKEKWHNLERQPVDDFLMGKWSCTHGADCHDRTHQAGLIDGGNQYYDNYPMGSIDRNSPQSIHAEY